MKATLEDLYYEQWLRSRNKGELVWETKDGTNVPVKDMTDEHLDNAIRYMERMEERRDIYVENSNSIW